MYNRDSIDCSKADIGKLKLKILTPTLIGLISVITVTIVNGFLAVM